MCVILGGMVETSEAVVLGGCLLLFVGGGFAFLSGRAVLLSPLVRVRLANTPPEDREMLQQANAKMTGTLLMAVAATIAAIAILV